MTLNAPQRRVKTSQNEQLNRMLGICDVGCLLSYDTFHTKLTEKYIFDRLRDDENDAGWCCGMAQMKLTSLALSQSFK